MSSLIKKSFKSAKCKTLLKLTVSRIKLLRNKRNVVAKQSRNDVALLLQKGQESDARARVEHVLREENILAAYDFIEQFCEHLAGRLPIIESQKECPPELKEAITSLIYAAPRCAELQELQKIRELFTLKYGKEFAVTAIDLHYGCGVSPKIIEKLSTRAPSDLTTLKLLKEIATEYKIDWNPGKDASKSKLPEDLLDGPKNFLSASQSLKKNVPVVPADSSRKKQDSTHSNFPSTIKEKQQTPATHDTGIATPFHNSPSSLSSPDYHNEVSLLKVKTPPPGKYASLTRHTPLSTNGGADTRKELQFNNAQVTSEMDIYAKAKAAGKMDYENIQNPWMHTDTDRTSSSGVDPYAIAKAEGRMDYNNSIGQNKGNQSTKQKEEREGKTQEARFYQDAGAEAERHMNHRTHNSHPRVGNELPADGRQHENVLIPQEMSGGKPIKATSPISKLTKSDSRSEYPDVATAAQVAFEAAAHAAEAAKAAIDMVGIGSRMRSNNKLAEADSSGEEGDLNPSPNLQKFAQTIGDNRSQWDSKKLFEREYYEDKAHKDEDSLIEESLSPYRFVTYSTVHENPVHPSRLHFSTETTNGALDTNYNTVDKGSHLQFKQERDSTETKFLTDKSFKNVYLNQLTEPSKMFTRDSQHADNAKMQSDTLHHGMDVFEIEDQLSDQVPSFGENSSGEEEPDELLDSGWKDQLEDSAQILRSDPRSADSKAPFDTSSHGIFFSEIGDQASPEAVRFDRKPPTEDEPDKCFSFKWKHQISNQIELHEKDIMQYQSEKPRFDDCDSEDSVDSEVPFYTKGRAAIGIQYDGLFASNLPVGKPKDAEDSDAGEELTPKKPLADEKSEADLDTREVQGFIKQDDCEFPQFDDYAEPPQEVPVGKCSPASSKSIFSTENLTQGRLNGIDDVLSGSRGVTPVTDTMSYHKHDKETHCKLGWHPTSEKVKFHLQFDEPSSEAENLRSVHLSSYNEDNEDEVSAHNQGWSLGSQANKRGEPDTANSHRKLRWHSSTSDEFDLHSQSDDPSPSADKVRSVKLSSHNEHGDNEGEGVLATRENRRDGFTETNRPLKGNTFFGESRRSVRSTRSQLRQDPSHR